MPDAFYEIEFRVIDFFMTTIPTEDNDIEGLLRLGKFDDIVKQQHEAIKKNVSISPHELLLYDVNIRYNERTVVDLAFDPDIDHWHIVGFKCDECGETDISQAMHGHAYVIAGNQMVCDCCDSKLVDEVIEHLEPIISDEINEVYALEILQSRKEKRANASSM